MGITLYEHTYFYLQNTHKESNLHDEKFRNNVPAKPSFHLYVTDELHLRYILQAYQSHQTFANTHVLKAPSATSSNLVLEVTKDSSNQFLVEVTYNDNPVTLGGCTSSPCKATDFVQYLNTVLNGITSVADVCNSAMEPQPTPSKFLVQ